MKLRVILILVAILAVAGTTYYFVSRPKTPPAPDAKHFVWNFDMDNLQNVTMSMPKANVSESFVKHLDNQEFYFDVANGPEVDM